MLYKDGGGGLTSFTLKMKDFSEDFIPTMLFFTIIKLKKSRMSFAYNTFGFSLMQKQLCLLRAYCILIQ